MVGSGKHRKEKYQPIKSKLYSIEKEPKLLKWNQDLVSCVGKHSYKSTTSGSVHLSFPGPKRHDNYRICSHLQSQNSQNHASLFERHIGTLPIQCLKFIGMKINNRRKLAIKAKFCVYCLHPDVEYSADHAKSCKEAKRKMKSSFTCISPNCSCHYWLCTNRVGHTILF